MATELDPRLIFDRFVVGPANGLAVGAGRRVAESLGYSYNPLVICGPAGLGKTHLLNAIGHLTQSMDPDLQVRYETVEALVDRLTTHISRGSVDKFRGTFDRLNMLLLDDLQELAGKGRTQAELLRLWKEMVERGAQVVIATDRPLLEIPALDEQLITHLESGLVVDIGVPEADTRLNILFLTLRERGASLPTEVVEALARLPIPNVRELQASLDRILETVKAEQREPSPEWVADLLGVHQQEAAEADEFGSFMSDISTAVASVVETSPWRRDIAEAILRWEGEGIRTHRLEEILDADSAPEVEVLLQSFERDVARLREIRRELREPPDDPEMLSDPDRLAELEALLAARRSAAAAPAPRPPRAKAAVTVDRWFLDHEKLALNWLALEDRLVEELV